MTAPLAVNVRLIEQQVSLLARERGLRTDAATALQTQLVALHEWVLSFRALVSKVRELGDEHLDAARALGDTLERSRLYLATHGALVIGLKADRPVSEEGVSLPTGESENDYPMFGFYRDGVTRITLKPGLGADELSALVGALLHPPQGTEDDTVTYLWYARLENVRIEIDAAFTPRNAAALLAAHPSDPVIASYVSAFAAAGPRFRGADNRKPYTAADAAQIGPLGVTPAYAHAVFSAPVPDPWFAPPSAQRREDFGVHIEDLHDREFRLVRIHQHATAPVGDDNV